MDFPQYDFSVVFAVCCHLGHYSIEKFLTDWLSCLPESVDERLRRAGNVVNDACEALWGLASRLWTDVLLARPELVQEHKSIDVKQFIKQAHSHIQKGTITIINTTGYQAQPKIQRISVTTVLVSLLRHQKKSYTAVMARCFAATRLRVHCSCLTCAYECFLYVAVA